MGLGFCPLDPLKVTHTIKDLYLFARNLTYKFIFDGDRACVGLEHELAERTKQFTVAEFRALRDLMLLYDESNPEHTEPISVPEPDLSQEPPSIRSPRKLFRLPSRRFPDLMTCPSIWSFVQATIRDLKRQEWQKITPNLTNNQMKALKTLQKNPEIVIKQSDKGGNIVLMTHSFYQDMCLSILNNHHWYCRISSTLISSFSDELKVICTEAFFKGLIDKDTLEYLTPKFPRLPTFYALPKTHKNLQKPPGRPIVSGIGSLTDHTGKFVDAFLMPHVVSLPSYIRDTTDLLRHIEGTQVPPDALLVALDVEALYSSIPHERGVRMAGSFLYEQENTSWPLVDFILQLLLFILTKNYFTFNDELFLQTQGVAMGTSCAPAYANLYLGGWERFLNASEMFSRFMDKILLWYRFIDDLFIIWTGSSESLLEFVQMLNVNEFNLRFTVVFDENRVPFLDLVVIKQTDGTLHTDLYRKPTAGNTLLYASSAHPKPLIRSIPFAQYLRLRRNCTLPTDFKTQADALRVRLLARGYTHTNLKRAYNRACLRSRHSLLYDPSKNKLKGTHEPVRFITTYSAHHNELRNILQKHWHMLIEDNILKKYVKV